MDKTTTPAPSLKGREAILFRVIAVLQCVLGIACLFFPRQFLGMMGLSDPAAASFYPLGMLASRFIAYGIGFWIVAPTASANLVWIRLMAVIQAVDAAV